MTLSRGALRGAVLALLIVGVPSALMVLVEWQVFATAWAFLVGLGVRAWGLMSADRPKGLALFNASVVIFFVVATASVLTVRIDFPCLQGCADSSRP